MPTRRQFLTGLGATATALAATGPAAAQTSDPYAPQPDYVTLSYPDSELETYRPYLVTRHLNVRPTDLRAWKATSAEQDTSVYCYWANYVTQTGFTSADSHVDDREPVYVFVDQSGSVERVVVDGYHYLAAEYPDPPTTGDTHPTLHVNAPYHFYYATNEIGDGSVPIRDMHDRYEGWVDNGWQVHKESVVRPWNILSRRHWWADGLGGVAYNATYWSLLLDIGQTVGLDLGGAQQADLSNLE
jgi:hypothetical protein